MKFKILDRQVAKGRQSVIFNEFLETSGLHKLHIEIKSDSYDFQSFCHLFVLNKDTMQWNIIVARPYGNMETPAGLHIGYVGAHQITVADTIPKFMKDRQWLLDMFTKLLS